MFATDAINIVRQEGKLDYGYSASISNIDIIIHLVNDDSYLNCTTLFTKDELCNWHRHLIRMHRNAYYLM